MNNPSLAVVILALCLTTCVATRSRLSSASSPSAVSLPSIRPPPSERKFNSTAINSLIASVSSRMVDPDLATLFSNCLPSTLDTTVESFTPSIDGSYPDAFVITGDINAQWFRDSTNQVLPYVPYAEQDKPLQNLVCGLVRRQCAYILIDPYANSFNFNASGAGHQGDTRHPRMTPIVFEGKFELDSLAAVLKLAYAYYNYTGDSTCFLEDDLWLAAVEVIYETITAQQETTLPADGGAPYFFQRETNTPTDTLMLSGVGNIGRRTGMCKSSFRPSDDSTLFPFSVPGNAMAVVELRHAGKLVEVLVDLDSVQRDPVRLQRVVKLGERLSDLANELDAGIQSFGIVPIPSRSPSVLGFSLPAAVANMYAYEVDGYGGQTVMDDANVPSLLSLPYLGYTSRSDPLYLATRRVLLSSNNPYYFNGTAGSGIGGPHVGLNYIWPMSLIIQAMTSNDDSEIRSCLEILKASSAGTGWLHESFNKNDVTRFTRPWFAWVNGLFGSLILQLAEERPYLIFKQNRTMAN